MIEIWLLIKFLLKSAGKIKFSNFLDSGGPWPEKKILGSGSGDLGSDGFPIKSMNFLLKSMDFLDKSMDFLQKLKDFRLKCMDFL